LKGNRGLIRTAKRALFDVAPGFMRKWQGPTRWHYSIGIYSGDSLFSLAMAPEARNPVLTRHDVTDTLAGAVADPFIIKANGRWYMFMEVVSQITWRGEIAYASSDDGFNWQYGSLVLQEPFHMSYPYVFEWQGEHYMIPETGAAREVRLYKASRFPDRWEYVSTLLDGMRAVDSSIFRHEDRWWLFTDCGADHCNPTLRLYSASELEGPWTEHPSSPIDQTIRTGRPGGRVVSVDGKLVRFTQYATLDPKEVREVNALEILELTESDYQERMADANPVLAGGAQSWNEGGHHHVDSHRLADGTWLACVDGLERQI
jgi:hypothetical protein